MSRWTSPHPPRCHRCFSLLSVCTDPLPLKKKKNQFWLFLGMCSVFLVNLEAIKIYTTQQPSKQNIADEMSLQREIGFSSLFLIGNVYVCECEGGGGGGGERNSVLPRQRRLINLICLLPCLRCFYLLFHRRMPHQLIPIVALSCFVFSRFSLLLFTWFDRVLASGSKTVTLVAAWQEFDQGEMSVGVPVSSGSDQTSLKRETEPDLIRGHFCNVGVRQVDTMSAQ